MLRVLKAVDKCSGYVFGPTEDRSLESLMSCAVGAEFEYDKIKNVRERYMETDDMSDSDWMWQIVNEEEECDRLEYVFGLCYYNHVVELFTYYEPFKWLLKKIC